MLQTCQLVTSRKPHQLRRDLQDTNILVGHVLSLVPEWKRRAGLSLFRLRLIQTIKMTVLEEGGENRGSEDKSKPYECM